MRAGDGRGSATDWRPAVSIRDEGDGHEIGREDVTDADLADVLCEAWMEGHLRKGELSVAPEDLARRLVPIRRDAGSGIAGYAVETADRRGRRARREFTVRSLQHVATRGAHRLIAEGVLEENDYYLYVLAEGAADGGSGSGEAAPFRLENRSRGLDLLSVPLPALLERASPTGDGDGQVPVFYTEEALEKAETYSRRGGTFHPPVESGGVLVGPVCTCPETGELFVVVSDVLEARDAERSAFSLSYSGPTWARIQTVIRGMRSQEATRAFRIVGQCHGHNFLPADGAPPCDACAGAEVCGRTSVFVSPDDLRWSRAVFARQPWRLCHIFGWNARQEAVDGLFGLRDGRLLERGFHVIPDFTPPGVRS